MLLDNETRRCLSIHNLDIQVSFHLIVTVGGVDTNCDPDAFNHSFKTFDRRDRYLFLSPPGSLPSMDDYITNQAFLNNYFYLFAYRMLKVRKLKFPFETDCIDYYPLQTQSKCIEDCIISKYRSQMHYPRNIPKFDLTKPYGDIHFRRDDCPHCMNQECDDISYNLQSTGFLNEIDNKFYMMSQVRISFDPQMEIIQLIPKVTSEVLVIYIFSALASCFGLAVIDFFGVVCMIIKFINVFLFKSRIPANKFLIKIVKWLFVMGCITGTIYQSYYVLIVYWNNETLTEVSVKHIDSMRFPSVTFCLKCQSLIKMKNPFNLGSVSYINPPFNVSASHFDSFLYAPNEIFEEIKITTGKNKLILKTRDQISHFFENNLTLAYFASIFKCFEFSVTGLFRGEPNEWISFKIFKNISTDIVTTNIGTRRFLNGFPYIYRTDNESVTIYFEEVIRTVRLPKPYPSDCKDFQAEGYEEASRCFYDCATDFFTLEGKFPTHAYMPADSKSYRSNNVNTLNCSKCLGSPCEQLNMKYDKKIYDDGMSEYRYYAPSRIKEIRMRPRTSFLEVVFMVHQIISSWMGFHMSLISTILWRIKVRYGECLENHLTFIPLAK